MKKTMSIALLICFTLLFIYGCDNDKQKNVSASKSIYDQPLDARNYIKLQKQLAYIKEETPQKYWDGYITAVHFLATHAKKNLPQLYGGSIANGYSFMEINFNLCVDEENPVFLEMINGKNSTEILSLAAELNKTYSEKYAGR